MTAEYFKEFRLKYFSGKMSKEKMAVEFGVKYHTLRRYEGENSNPIPLVLQKSIQFFEEKEALKNQLKKVK
jgi:DNA-binding XRE family transcriptional regulator